MDNPLESPKNPCGNQGDVDGSPAGFPLIPTLIWKFPQFQHEISFHYHSQPKFPHGFPEPTTTIPGDLPAGWGGHVVSYLNVMSRVSCGYNSCISRHLFFVFNLWNLTSSSLSMLLCRKSDGSIKTLNLNQLQGDCGMCNLSISSDRLWWQYPFYLNWFNSLKLSQ